MIFAGLGIRAEGRADQAWGKSNREGGGRESADGVILPVRVAGDHQRRRRDFALLVVIGEIALAVGAIPRAQSGHSVMHAVAMRDHVITVFAQALVVLGAVLGLGAAVEGN